MAKFTRVSKLSSQEQQKLLIGFCKALVELKTPEEAAQFLKDLLSRQEAEMLAKRIEIARLLIKGHTYGEVGKMLRVSHGTVARVSQWLATSGEGYRLIVSRVKPEKTEQQEFVEDMEKPVSWKNIKRKYSMYFWPDLILEEFVRSAKKREKERMEKILSQFDKKSEMLERLQGLLREEYKAVKKTKI
jgi:TrpR-related protein YerC/YecD